MMHYRRFGKTEIQIPVITCGGMRYQQAWQDLALEEIDSDGQANLEATIRRAVELGANHIETARGYGSSEMQLGRVLPTFPRDEIIVQTKVGPTQTEEEFLKNFDTSMNYLQLDHVEMLSIHGINNDEVLEQALTRGALSGCRKIQAEGRAKHIGFSTHGPCDSIVRAIETDEFSYVNLHWYLFDQCNERAVQAAADRDMGVFIISPNDKGGRLYDPPQKLVDLCAPLTPMAVNDLFCLADPRVHTLSMGVSKPTDFDAHIDAMPSVDGAAETIAPILAELRQATVDVLGADWADHWTDGLPSFVPGRAGEIPIYHILRLYTLVKAFDMVEFGKMRYNLLGNGGHWFAGYKVDELDWNALPAALEGYRFADRVPDMLRETHELLKAEDQKRLSES